MPNEVNWQISWLLFTNLQNETQCVGFFTRTYKIKHNTDGPFLLRDFKKSQRKYIVSGDWNKNFLGGNKSKN